MVAQPGVLCTWLRPPTILYAALIRDLRSMSAICFSNSSCEKLAGSASSVFLTFRVLITPTLWAHCLQTPEADINTELGSSYLLRISHALLNSIFHHGSEIVPHVVSDLDDLLFKDVEIGSVID